MQLDIKRAITYFFKKTGWKKIWLILIGISLIGMLPVIGPIVSMIFFSGYFLLLMNTRIFKPDEVPDFDVEKIGIIGFKFFGFYLIFIIFCVLINQIMQAQISSGKPSLPIIICLLVVLLLITVFYGASTLVFATNLKFSSFFKFKAIKYILVDKFADYFIFGCTVFLVIFAYALVIGISAITIVGPLLLMPLFMLALADLNAQFVRRIFKLEENHKG